MNRSLIVSLVVLVALLGVYMIINSARDVTSQAEAFFDADTSKIDAIRIVNKIDDIQLRKSGSLWRLAEPIDYPADMRFTDDMLKKVGSMVIENLVTTDTEKDSIYGLDTAAVEITLSAGGKDVAHFMVGKSADNMRHTYCRKVGSNEIYRVKGTFTGQLKRKQKDWRDKDIIQIDQDVINRVDFKYPDETFALVKGDTAWTVEIGSENRPVEERFLNQTLSVVSRLRTFDYVDGDSARAIDFSYPVLDLKVTTDVGDTYEFVLIPYDAETSKYYLKKQGMDNTIFVIYAGAANAFMKRPDDYKPVVKDEG